MTQAPLYCVPAAGHGSLGKKKEKEVSRPVQRGGSALHGRGEATCRRHNSYSESMIALKVRWFSTGVIVDNL